MSKSIIKQKRILTKASGGSSLATPVSIANGGTGLSSYAVGDILYASGTTTLSKLPIGTASQQLRVNAGATALEYFTPAASGITVGTTTITSGTTGSILMDIGGIVSNSISYRAQQATPFLTAFGFENAAATPTGINNTFYGYQAGKTVTTGSDNTFIGFQAGQNSYFPATGITTGSRNVIVGSRLTPYSTGANDNVLIGSGTNGASLGSSNIGIGTRILGDGNTNGHSNCIAIGHNAGLYLSNNCIGSISIGSSAYGAENYSIAIGYNAVTTAVNQMVIGGQVTSTISNLYFNGVAYSSPASVVINACGGSGTNIAGASLTLAGGKGTGTGTPGSVIFQVATTGSTGSTLQTLATKLTVAEARITATVPIKLMGYTVATLPAGAVGDMAYVTDALAPAFLVAIAGGGAVVTPVFYDGVNWVAH